MIELSIRIIKNNITTYDINAAKRVIIKNFNVYKENIRWWGMINNNQIKNTNSVSNQINSILKPNEDIIYFYFNIDDKTIEQNIFDIINKTKQELGNALGIKSSSLKINIAGIF